MEKLSNKMVVFLTLIPWSIMAVFAFIAGYMGYEQGSALTSVYIENALTFTGVVLFFFALYRLYKAPDNYM